MPSLQGRTCGVSQKPLRHPPHCSTRLTSMKPIKYSFLSFVFCFAFLAFKSYAETFYLGADLSYVNEMEDCGAVYRDKGKPHDPFELFARKGANLIRVRLWHTPDWTRYSTLADATKTIRRAKQQGLPVLLDFHYSDNWADPERQEIPKAWSNIQDTKMLGKALYDYTFATLQSLAEKNLLPEMVQVGNETNAEILQPEGKTDHENINWPRNAYLLNQGIKAVRDFSAAQDKKILIVLHIAQPENALRWFPQAQQHGVTDYDIIGLSYYPQWSEYTIQQLPDAIQSLKKTFDKDILIVETAYPWTLKNFDKAGNVLGEKAVLPEFKPTPEGQLLYLLGLAQTVKSAGGLGVIYWEPAWVSTQCKTRWGIGSHWENASFFHAGKKNSTLPAFLFFSADYQKAETITSDKKDN